MSNPNIHANLGNRIRRVSFEQFTQAAMDISNLVRVHQPEAIIKVDVDEMTGRKTTASGRYSCELGEVGPETWGRARNIGFNVNTPGKEDNYWISLKYDSSSPRQLFLYAQQLDNHTQQELLAYLRINS